MVGNVREGGGLISLVAANSSVCPPTRWQLLVALILVVGSCVLILVRTGGLADVNSRVLLRSGIDLRVRLATWMNFLWRHPSQQWVLNLILIIGSLTLVAHWELRAGLGNLILVVGGVEGMAVLVDVVADRAGCVQMVGLLVSCNGAIDHWDLI